jgi:hypothetical protein
MSAAKLLTSASRNRLDLFSNGSLSPNLWTAAVQYGFSNPLFPHWFFF